MFRGLAIQTRSALPLRVSLRLALRLSTPTPSEIHLTTTGGTQDTTRHSILVPHTISLREMTIPNDARPRTMAGVGRVLNTMRPQKAIRDSNDTNIANE